MKPTTISRIFHDSLVDRNLKELYWGFSKSAHRYKQLLNADNHVFAKAVVAIRVRNNTIVITVIDFIASPFFLIQNLPRNNSYS